MKTEDGIEVVSQTINNRAPAPKKKKESHLFRNMLILVLILLLIVAAGAGAFVWYALYGWEEKEELDLVNNIDVSDLGLDGYDGEGILNYDESYLASIVGYSGTSSEVKKFIESVSYTVTPDTDISNGDTVTIKAEYDKKKASKAGVKVVRDTKKIVIEELDEKDEEGYNYGSADDATESTDTFDDPEDDYSGNGNEDYTENDMYSGGGLEYVTMTADGKDGYVNVRKKPGTDSDVVVKLTNGLRVDVYDLEDGWYKIATGPYKGCYVHESTLSD
ncbi:MAG: SH3 domain-containing protein [Eubacterium sp.]|nr:SH3 domain-containing protein [Eubacterium sp.]